MLKWRKYDIFLVAWINLARTVFFENIYLPFLNEMYFFFFKIEVLPSFYGQYQEYTIVTTSYIYGVGRCIRSPDDSVRFGSWFFPLHTLLQPKHTLKNLDTLANKSFKIQHYIYLYNSLESYCHVIDHHIGVLFLGFNGIEDVKAS